MECSHEERKWNHSKVRFHSSHCPHVDGDEDAHCSGGRACCAGEIHQHLHHQKNGICPFEMLHMFKRHGLRVWEIQLKIIPKLNSTPPMECARDKYKVKSFRGWNVTPSIFSNIHRLCTFEILHMRVTSETTPKLARPTYNSAIQCRPERYKWDQPKHNPPIETCSNVYTYSCAPSMCLYLDFLSALTRGDFLPVSTDLSTLFFDIPKNSLFIWTRPHSKFCIKKIREHFFHTPHSHIVGCGWKRVTRSFE
jgi:hypothetical protein